MSFFSLPDIQGRFFEIIKRFPIVIFFALVTTITLLIAIDFTGGDSYRWPVAGYIGFLAMLNLSIGNEAFALSKKMFWIIFGALILLLMIYYSFIPTDLVSTSSCFWFFTIGLSVILHLMVSLVPFLKKYSQEAFINFNVRIYIAWMQAALYSIILFAALSLAILALDQLFSIHFDYMIYFRLFILISGIFHTSFFLSEIPDNFYEVKLPASKSIFKILTSFVIIPMVMVYGLILYAYILKIVFTGSMIVGWVSVLIIWYFIIGILSYLFSQYFNNESDNRIMKIFRKWYFVVSLPFLILLFKSMYDSNLKFGIQEDLYMTTICAVFIALISLYLVISKTNDKRIFPVLLIILALITFMGGPVSFCTLPVSNQQDRLIKDFESIGIIKNGVIVIDSTLNYYDSQSNIQQKLSFLQQRKALGFLKSYDKNNLITNFIDSTDVYALSQKLGINVNARPSDQHQINLYFDSKTPLDIQGFQRIVPIKNTYDEIAAKDYVIFKGQQILLFMDDVEVGMTDISKELKTMAITGNKNNRMEISVGEYTLRIYVFNATIDDKKVEKINILDIQGIVLLRKNN